MVQKIDGKTLITGADGMVGSYFNSGTRLSKKDCDVTNISRVREVLEQERPSAVIHLAALTDMNLCEKDKDLAYAVNELGARNIATVAKSIGAKVIYVSSNAVFDGKKQGAYNTQDIPHPISVYGDSKYKGELAVLGASPRNLVVRSSWIFGGGPEKDKKFVGKVVPKISLGEPIKAVSDVYGTPTYGKDLVEAIQEAISEGKTGVIHVVNKSKASRYDMAVVIKTVFNSKSEITGAPLASFPSTGNTLQNEMLESDMKLRPWQEALKEYVETEWKMFIKK